MNIPDLIPATYACPYCGEANELLIDPGGGKKQLFVEDCQVCCRPAAIGVRLDEGGMPSITVEPES